MAAKQSPGKGRLLNVVLIGLIVVAALAAKPLKIIYHDSAMRSAWSASFEQGQTNVASVVKFEHHCNALVSLGYLVKREFSLAQIKSHSPEHRSLFEALNAHAAKGNGYFLMQGFEETAPSKVTVFSPAGKMADWESIISSRDRPK
jgi:hypothetical protein